MVKFYLNRINKGLMELEEVPAKWFDAVKKTLEADSKAAIEAE